MKLNSRAVFSILTFGDKVLVVILVLGALFSFGFIGFISEEGRIATVSISNSQKFTKQLSVNEDFVIQGEIGVTKARVANHSIRIISSDCPRKLCVRQGEIKRVGEILVCVPNKITIWIEGEKRVNKFDAITG